MLAKLIYGFLEVRKVKTRCCAFIGRDQWVQRNTNWVEGESGRALRLSFEANATYLVARREHRVEMIWTL